MSRYDAFTKMKSPLNARGIDFSVYVTSFGTFIAEIAEDDWIEAKTLGQLKIDLEKVVKERSQDIAVPFCLISVRNGVRKGAVRGIHAGNGDFLVTWHADGSKDNMSKLSQFSEVPSGEVQARMAEIVSDFEKLTKEAWEIINSVPKFEGAEMARRVKEAMKNNV